MRRRVRIGRDAADAADVPNDAFAFKMKSQTCRLPRARGTFVPFCGFPQLEAAVDDVTERPAACAQIAAAMTFGDGCFPH